MECTCNPYPGGVPFLCAEGAMFDDPIQGATENCCLIASLSAVAWTMASIRIKISSGSRGTYNVMLYNTSVTVSEKLALDAYYNFCYAHSRPPYLNEIWPGLYEKAVAKNLHQWSGECDVGGVNWDGNPSRYLNKLSGCRVSNITNDMATAIINRCSGGKIKYPSVVWNEGHCYTVLGYVGVPSDQRIFLRDPLGKNPAIPGIDTSGYYLSLVDHFRYDCVTFSMTSMGGYTLNLGNGIFGMKTSLVNEYFDNLSVAGR